MSKLTITQACDRLKLTRSRLHQIINQLGIVPERIEGPFGGQGYIYMLTERQVKQIENRPKDKPGPKANTARPPKPGPKGKGK